jgi:hypothetical protein
MYGHIENNDRNFFISILNPSKLDFDYNRYNTTAPEGRLGYAYAILNGADLEVKPRGID